MLRAVLGSLAIMCVAAAPCARAEPNAPYAVETVAAGLEFPWSIAFLRSGDMLVTERAGRLRVVRGGALLPDAVTGVPAVHVAGQGGLLDVIEDPAEDGTIYLSFSKGDASASTLAVVRARFDGAALSEVTTIYEAAPPRAASVHYGGRMAFLTDGTLLITGGDGFDDREAAQDLGSDLGKIVRIRTDGSVPEDNPFTAREGARPEIWSYGHRNVQGIAVDGATGRVWAHEHGPAGGDEVNLIVPGANYGWPVITRGLDYSGAKITPYAERPGMEQPVVDWTPSIAPAGLVLYDGALFPDWRGDLLVAALVSQDVKRIDLDANGNVLGEHALFADQNARIRDVRVAPDGSVFLLTDAAEGAVLRVAPAGL